MGHYDEEQEPLPNGVFRLTTVYRIRYVITGILWLIYGILNFFDDSSMPLKICSTVLMFLAIGCIVFSFLVKQEPEDEFSVGHLRQAALYVLAGVVFFIMVFSVASVFVSLTLDFALLYPFLIGGIMLAVGVIWLQLEHVAFFG